MYICISNALSEQNREGDFNTVNIYIIVTSCLPPTFTPQNRDEVCIHLSSFIEVVEQLFIFRGPPPPPGGVMNLKTSISGSFL